MWKKLIQHVRRAPSSDAGNLATPRLAGSVVRISPDARAVMEGNNLALFHAARGLMFKSNRIGAQIWESLANNLPPAEVARGLAQRYRIPLEQANLDVVRFIAQLLTAELVHCGGE